MAHNPVIFAENYFVCKESSSNSRHRQFIKDFLDDRFAGFFLRLGFVGDGQVVAKILCEMTARQRRPCCRK